MWLSKLFWYLLIHLKLTSHVSLRVHWSAYYDRDSSFGGFNYFGKRVRIENCKIGHHSYVTANTEIRHALIGSYCSIAHEIRIGGFHHHDLNNMTTSPAILKTLAGESGHLTPSRVVIGHDVWIGARAIILDGVRIGNGAVIAAGSVVTRDVDAYSIVAGVPARRIRDRKANLSAEKLNSSRWWTLPPDDAAELLKKITNSEE